MMAQAWGGGTQRLGTVIVCVFYGSVWRGEPASHRDLVQTGHGQVRPRPGSAGANERHSASGPGPSVCWTCDLPRLDRRPLGHLLPPVGASSLPPWPRVTSPRGLLHGDSLC